MRILGIETSSARGSVALVEAGRAVTAATHERENAHEQSLLPLIERILAEAGWNARSLQRIAVATGPGSFTGLRVGIALAQGVSEGLGIPLVGVGSLEAMAAAAPPELSGARVAVLDARRAEVFLGAYAEDGRELLAPQVVEARAAAELAGSLGRSGVLLGKDWQGELPGWRHHRSDESDLPHARWIAALAARCEPGPAVVPLYLRPPTAVVPVLSPNPLAPKGLAPAS